MAVLTAACQQPGRKTAELMLAYGEVAGTMAPNAVGEQHEGPEKPCGPALGPGGRDSLQRGETKRREHQLRRIASRKRGGCTSPARKSQPEAAPAADRPANNAQSDRSAQPPPPPQSPTLPLPRSQWQPDNISGKQRALRSALSV